MKRRYLNIGSCAALTLPIIAAISCGKDDAVQTNHHEFLYLSLYRIKDIGDTYDIDLDNKHDYVFNKTKIISIRHFMNTKNNFVHIHIADTTGDDFFIYKSSLLKVNTHNYSGYSSDSYGMKDSEYEKLVNWINSFKR